MSGTDDYYNRAKQAGYRSRAAYKLRGIDDAADLLAPGTTVVDLGAAPGGWLQVAAERVGPDGRVVGVDRRSIDPLEAGSDDEESEAGAGDGAAPVETVRGDMTDADTRERVAEIVGEAGANVVCSDMAPNMTGEYSVDHARSVHLARQALDTALAVLAPGGDFVAKVFDGPDLDDLRADLEAEFEHVREVRPDASRDSSSELYLVARSRVDAPVSEGEERSVEVEDVGSEGDGVAKVDGYTIFVPDAEAGETVRVRVEDVKANYAFAARLAGDDGAP